MDTKFDFGNLTEEQLVYVRPVATRELPDDVRDQLGEITQIYAVHDANGQRLALVKDRDMAFVLARQNDMAPVTVH